MVSSNFSHTFKRYIFINNVVSYTLSSIILFLYLTFILIIGFYPNLFQIYLFNGSVTLGIAFGLFIIIFSIFLTLIYVVISNLYLDKLKNLNEFFFFFSF